MSDVRLLLVGDDDALEVIAELGRHLPLFELVRIDDLEDRTLGEEDVLVIGASHVRSRDALLRDAMSRGSPRHVVVVSQARSGGDAGARAILASAELVRVLFPEAGG